MPRLAFGHYSIVYSDGQYRTIRISDWNGKAVVGISTPKRDRQNNFRFQGVGFLTDDNQIRFWHKFEQANEPKRLTRIRYALDVVAREPEQAQMAFAMKESKCARCGRTLTVPASLHRGLGPECAKKGHWTKHDNQLAFEHQRENAA